MGQEVGLLRWSEYTTASLVHLAAAFASGAIGAVQIIRTRHHACNLRVDPSEIRAIRGVVEVLGASSNALE